MPQTLEDKLVVGISSRALFDLAEANALFEQHGLSAYREYQREHERDVLEPGTAYPLVKGLLAVNERAGEPLVDVIIFSRNDADSAMRVLRSRLYDLALQEQQSTIAQDRRSQVGSGDRSEKIRTYNYPQNRVTDHRIGLTLHSLTDFLDGNINPVLEALFTHYQAERLKEAV